MESTKLNANRQLVLTKGHRKAIITKISSRKWAYRTGWVTDVVLTGGGYLPTKRDALVYARDWINDQG